MTPVIGIDFGTTNTVVSYFKKNGKLRPMRYHGEDSIPSHHAALTNLAVVLAVVRLEASGVVVDVVDGAGSSAYHPVHVHLEEHVLGVGVL